VVPDPAVVVLVTVRDRARRRVRDVVKALARPGDLRALRVRDRDAEIVAARNVAHVQRRHLGAPARQPDRDETGIRRRVVPVDRHETVAVELVRVDERPVMAVHRVSHVQHRLRLGALAPQVKDPSRHGPRRPEEPDREQLAQPLSERVSLRQRIEHRPRARVLRLRPLRHPGARRILEPAVGIDDALAEVRVHHVPARCEGRRRDLHLSRC
jgi:hypothetical protein